MKKSLIMLSLAALLSMSSQGQTQRSQADQSSQIDPYRQSLLQKVQHDTTKVGDRIFVNDYIWFGRIKAEYPEKSMDIAKLLDVTEYNLAVESPRFSSTNNYTYYLPTFQVGEKRISLICNQAVPFVRGANYQINYWKISWWDKTEESFFRGYVYDNRFNNETIEFSKNIDDSVEGIIAEIHRIDSEVKK
jgi:hypothetical protein